MEEINEENANKMREMKRVEEIKENERNGDEKINS